jgi:hypothetical protein
MMSAGRNLRLWQQVLDTQFLLRIVLRREHRRNKFRICRCICNFVVGIVTSLGFQFLFFKVASELFTCAFEIAPTIWKLVTEGETFGCNILNHR